MFDFVVGWQLIMLQGRKRRSSAGYIPGRCQFFLSNPNLDGKPFISINEAHRCVRFSTGLPTRYCFMDGFQLVMLVKMSSLPSLLTEHRLVMKRNEAY